MNQYRDTPLELNDADLALGLRPLTARSLIASVLLGTHPPRLPVRVLVAAASLFGISEGSARTALSRMLAAGELERVDEWYGLGPDLVARQNAQDTGRAATRSEWTGDWHQLVVTSERRSASDRATTRSLLLGAHLAELRDGIWIRPANTAIGHLVEQLPGDDWLTATTRFTTTPDCAALWPIADLAHVASGLDAIVAELAPRLAADDRSLLARGFVVAAAALRFFRSDPLLPHELLPADWAGDRLRQNYVAFDTAYRKILRNFFAEANG
ncbi:MAG: PaaX family transcriptional regulator C-terminal domain-containing protein [Acidimicrobiales bacterium]